VKFQTSIKPREYAINMQAMTKEKLQLVIPVVFTVGPHDPALTGQQSLKLPSGGLHSGEPEDPASSLMKVSLAPCPGSVRQS